MNLFLVFDVSVIIYFIYNTCRTILRTASNGPSMAPTAPLLKNLFKEKFQNILLLYCITWSFLKFKTLSQVGEYNMPLKTLKNPQKID